MARASSQEPADLSGALKRLARGRPVFIRRKGRNAYVLLSAARYRRMLERLEDLEDAADADRAIREFEASGEKAVAWEQVKHELGLG
ncbi:MAG: type II toxin-antitoxin system prevent-host-death family antitoxin [Deltaproteobacteria bacterium]|nr:type II toxin-antitoxin system prevent-host-death family antitoxin [Deltaproteobacteria bacterium]